MPALTGASLDRGKLVLVLQLWRPTGDQQGWICEILLCHGVSSLHRARNKRKGGGWDVKRALTKQILLKRRSIDVGRGRGGVAFVATPLLYGSRLTYPHHPASKRRGQA